MPREQIVVRVAYAVPEELERRAVANEWTLAGEIRIVLARLDFTFGACAIASKRTMLYLFQGDKQEFVRAKVYRAVAAATPLDEDAGQ
jgi:hypothetical protein